MEDFLEITRKEEFDDVDKKLLLHKNRNTSFVNYTGDLSYLRMGYYKRIPEKCKIRLSEKIRYLHICSIDEDELINTDGIVNLIADRKITINLFPNLRYLQCSSLEEGDLSSSNLISLNIHIGNLLNIKLPPSLKYLKIDNNKGDLDNIIFPSEMIEIYIRNYHSTRNIIDNFILPLSLHKLTLKGVNSTDKEILCPTDLKYLDIADVTGECRFKITSCIEYLSISLGRNRVYDFSYMNLITLNVRRAGFISKNNILLPSTLKYFNIQHFDHHLRNIINFSCDDISFKSEEIDKRREVFYKIQRLKYTIKKTKNNNFLDKISRLLLKNLDFQIVLK